MGFCFGKAHSHNNLKLAKELEKMHLAHNACAVTYFKGRLIITMQMACMARFPQTMKIFVLRKHHTSILQHAVYFTFSPVPHLPQEWEAANIPISLMKFRGETLKLR